MLVGLFGHYGQDGRYGRYGSYGSIGQYGVYGAYGRRRGAQLTNFLFVTICILVSVGLACLFHAFSAGVCWRARRKKKKKKKGGKKGKFIEISQKFCKILKVQVKGYKK